MIYFVIPCYNEEKNIAPMLRDTHVFLEKHELPHTLMVVNDGSLDGTAERVLEIQKEGRVGCELISYTPNRGVAGAFREGFHHALARAGTSDLIVTIEADRTGDLNILGQMLDQIAAGADVSLASCYAPGGGIEGTNAFRRFLSVAANGLIRFFFGMHHIHTYSSFYRVYRPNVLKAVQDSYGDFYEESGFGCVVELLVRIYRMKFKIEEIPMVLRGQMRTGKSKMRIGKTVLGYLRVIQRNSFR